MCLVAVNSPVKSLFYSRIHSRDNIMVVHGHETTFVFISRVFENVSSSLQAQHKQKNKMMTRFSSSRNVSEFVVPDTGSANQTGSFHLNRTKIKVLEKKCQRQRRQRADHRRQNRKVAVIFEKVIRSISLIQPQRRSVPNLHSYSSWQYMRACVCAFVCFILNHLFNSVFLHPPPPPPHQASILLILSCSAVLRQSLFTAGASSPSGLPRLWLLGWLRSFLRWLESWVSAGLWVMAWSSSPIQRCTVANERTRS